MRGFDRNALMTASAVVCVMAATPAAAQTKTFDVPAQAAQSAINALGRQADIQIIAARKVTRGKRTNAVRGNLTVQQALSALLEGTGLTYRQTGPQTYTIVEVQRTSAASQTPPEPAETALSVEDSGEGEGQEIVVTGTNIRGVAPSAPVITVTDRQIYDSGMMTVGEVVRSLPQNFNGGLNPQVKGAPNVSENAAFAGASSPNLRGLGAGSTLTLINGRRGGQLATSGAVDISLIPLDAISRIDVVTDGASATYGSDAVAGVVNLLLHKSFDGVRATLGISGSDQGGGSQFTGGALAGTHWSGGGVVAAYEYQRQDKILASQRDFSTAVEGTTYLLPDERRHSSYVRLYQNVTTDLKLWAEGLYANRRSEDATTAFGSAQFLLSDIEQYSIAGGADYSLDGGWLVSLTAYDSKQDTSTKVHLGPPDVTPLFNRSSIDGKTSGLQVSVDGPLFRIGERDVRIAIGVGQRTEEFIRGVSGQPATVDGHRKTRYAFAEAQLPLIAREGRSLLEANLSGRVEDPSDGASNFVPKIGLKFDPVDSLTFRVTWGKSFRMPPLYYKFAGNSVALIALPDASAPSGSTVVLVPQGGNRALQPERATSWTAGLQFQPRSIPGLRAAATYFNIRYRDRVAQVPNVFTALDDPGSAAFVTPNPTPAQQAALLEGAEFQNFLGQPYDPTAIGAIVDFRYRNFAKQRIHGVDLSIDYTIEMAKSRLNIFGNASFLDIEQKLTPASTETELTGTTFQPASTRVRAGITWESRRIVATVIANHVSGSKNTFLPLTPRVGSWTTFDGQITFSFNDDIKLGLSVQNIFNRNPPAVVFNDFVPGIGYDSTNTSPVGRFATLRLTTTW